MLQKAPAAGTTTNQPHAMHLVERRIEKKAEIEYLIEVEEEKYYLHMCKRREEVRSLTSKPAKKCEVDESRKGKTRMGKKE